MASRNELAIRANVVGLDHTTIPNDSKLEQKVLFLEKNATAFAGTAGTGVLTSDTTNVADGDTVTIGDRVYTFKTALTPAAGEVLIGAAAANSLQNLYDAINGSGTAGTQYAANTPVSRQVSATGVTATTVTVTVRNNNVTNASIATTETSAHLSWGGATISGGVAKVVAAGTTTAAGAPGISGDFNHL